MIEHMFEWLEDVRPSSSTAGDVRLGSSTG
jgi:hypothetical protein